MGTQDAAQCATNVPTALNKHWTNTNQHEVYLKGDVFLWMTQALPAEYDTHRKRTPCVIKSDVEPTPFWVAACRKFVTKDLVKRPSVPRVTYGSVVEGPMNQSEGSSDCYWGFSEFSLFEYTRVIYWITFSFTSRLKFIIVMESIFFLYDKQEKCC